MDRRAQAIVHLLMGLEVGIWVAAGALVLLANFFSTETNERLLAPAAWFSRVIGRAAGWNEHVIAQDPYGPWTQLFLVAGVVAVLFYLVSQFGNRSIAARVASSWFPGVLATTGPWVTFWILVVWEVSWGWPIDVLALLFSVLVLLFLLWVTLGPAYWCYRVHKNRGELKILAFTAFCSLAVWIMCEPEWPPYSEPIAWASLIVSILLFFAWLIFAAQWRPIVAGGQYSGDPG